MSDVPPPAPNPPTPPTCRLLDGGGICAEYRVKIERLHDASVASGAVTKLVLAAAAAAVTALGGLGAYLWSRLSSIDSTLTRAKEEIAAAASGVVVPVGTVVAWTAAEPPRPRSPDGKERELRVGDWHYHWRVCDGSEVDLVQHAQLSATIGSTYGKAENGKVKLPDFRGYFLRGAGGVAPHASSPIGSGQAQAVQAHEHNIVYFERDPKDNKAAAPRFNLTASPENQNWGSGQPQAVRGTGLRGTQVGFDGATDDTEVARPETRPVNHAVHWIIRVR